MDEGAFDGVGGDFLRYGYTVLCPKRRFPRFYQETVQGLPLLRAELPDEQRRTLTRCAAVMERYGVGRMLEGRLGAALPVVSTADLWQAHASALVLDMLEERQIPLERAVVALAAPRVSRRVLAATETLSDRVWAVALEIPGSEWLSLWLQQRNGVPVLHGGGHLMLDFFPHPAGGDRVALGVRQPQVTGWTLRGAGVELPEGCPVEPVLALLVERGDVPEEKICVVSTGFSR